jgi:Holliday junction resolvasome RuvABC endonuclease subunit
MALVVPEEYRTYKVFAIDPGLSNTGLSIIDVEYGTDKILRIETHNLNSEKLHDRTQFDSELTEERSIKLYKLKMELSYYLDKHKPAKVFCEAPFYNPLMPGAYRVLVQVVLTYQTAVKDFNGNTIFREITPMEVKKFVKAKVIKKDTEKGKFEMMKAVSEIPEITGALVKQLLEMTEHEIDSAAVGYTGLYYHPEV